MDLFTRLCMGWVSNKQACEIEGLFASPQVCCQHTQLQQEWSQIPIICIAWYQTIFKFKNGGAGYHYTDFYVHMLNLALLKTSVNYFYAAMTIRLLFFSANVAEIVLLPGMILLLKNHSIETIPDESKNWYHEYKCPVTKYRGLFQGQTAGTGYSWYSNRGTRIWRL